MDTQALLETCVDLSSTNDWLRLKETLEKLLGIENGFESVPVGPFLQLLNEILKTMLEKLEKDDKSEKIKCLADCFRCLRNACGRNPDLQGHLGSCPDLLQNSKLIVDKVLSFDSQSDVDDLSVLKCCIQFLGNACVHMDNKKIVWDLFVHDVMRRLLQHPDNKLCDYTCMMVHQCLSSLAITDLALLTHRSAQDVVLTCVQATAERDLEWGMFVLEDMLRSDMFLPTLFDKLAQQERLLLMEVVLAVMNELPPQTDATPGPGRDLAISPGNMYYLVEDVKREFSQILNLEAPEYSEQEKTMVIVKELEVLAGAAAHTACYPRIQADQHLLECAISLLRSVHEIGKTGNNLFTKVEKASRQDEVNPHHPVYGLKKDLIRLIANMAFHNKENQELTRNLDGIPLLLDQTSIDCHNPFITQWVVLAIRNLLEDNPANRDVLSGMSLQGMSGHMASLREMGVQTELRGGKIVVKPVKREEEKK